eukprot:8359444-Pyramimonas_sp.AAC.1
MCRRLRNVRDIDHQVILFGTCDLHWRVRNRSEGHLLVFRTIMSVTRASIWSALPSIGASEFGILSKLSMQSRP